MIFGDIPGLTPFLFVKERLRLFYHNKKINKIFTFFLFDSPSSKVLE